jgi:predicted MFS family arabinose efflux permease
MQMMPASEQPGVGSSFGGTPQRPREGPLLAALLFGNFVIGTGILLPAGMLTDLANGLSISVPQAGSLILVSGAACALTAPVAAALTSSIDRRPLLIWTLVLALLCNAVSALAPGFVSLALARVGIAIAAGIFTPQAASTLGALLPVERRSHGITMIFIGWSLATVAGIPLGGLLADLAGWRAAYAVLTVLSVASILAVQWTVPGGVTIPRLNSASWRTVATSPALMLVLLVTALNGTGHFTQFTYFNPTLKQALGASALLVTLVMAWFGIAATVGNFAATRLVAAIGPSRAAGVSLAAIAAGLALFGSVETSLPGVFAAVTLWGLGTFSTMSMQQARLAAHAPELTSASIALNTSAIYIGQAAGATLGGAIISAGHILQLAWAGSAILVVALALSLLARRYERH